MAKYAVLVNMDLNVELLDSTPIDEIEKITRNTVRILVGKKEKCEIKSLRVKLLGKGGEILMKRKVRKTEIYKHHGTVVTVQEGDKGKHRDHCLCWQCAFFCPWDSKLNCTIARVLYSLCVIFNIVTPVWECLLYQQALPAQQKRIDEFENK